MRATLEFNLPEDRSEFATASVAPKLLNALYDMREEFRRRRKHGDYRGRARVLLEELERFFFESCDGFDLDDLGG